MAKLPMVGVKLEPEMHVAIAKLAALEKKTVSEVVRELIEAGLARTARPDTQLIDELTLMHRQLAELGLRTLKASAGAKYFARLTTAFAQDLTSYVTRDEVLDQQTKQKQMEQFDRKCQELEDHFLKDPFNRL
jgi:phosphoserine phosphatase